MILNKLEELEQLITVPNVDKQPDESINAMKMLNLIVEIRGLVKNNAVLPHVKHRFSIDDPIIVKASLDIRSEHVCSNPLRKQEETDRHIKGYLVELLNSLNGA